MITGRVPRPISSGLALILGVLTLALVLGQPGSGAAAGSSGSAEPVAQTDDSLPASGVTMIGSSPAEAPGETWGIGQLNSNEWALVHYTESGWSLQPGLQDAAGQPLAGFEPAGVPGPGGNPTYALTGRVSEGGAGVLVGAVPDSESGNGVRQVVLVRSPGGAFEETAPIPQEGAGALLDPTTESIYNERRAPVIASLEESGGAGALVVPAKKGSAGLESAVLHWNGSSWSSEPIEIPKTVEEEGGFRVLALGASSPTNAWLLAQLSSTSNAVALFRRESGSKGETWVPVKPSPSGKEGEALTVPVQGASGEVPFTVPGTGAVPTTKSQILTVTSEGVWIDGERTDTGVSTTMYFKPTGEGPEGQIQASWCVLVGSAAGCTYALEQQLPKSAYRSYAWPNPADPFGERVITGLSEGVSLCLESSSFTQVLALGGSAAPNDVGGSYGAAFSNPQEGWLGNETLPVHLTLHPAPDLLQPYPVPFRHALAAVAPQPQAPVGAIGSEAVAVGDVGEVARYVPNQGWLPESLLEPGGHDATPRLRGVAWPTPDRVYAVGELGAMWLWRGETGYWEPDPAAPPNFRGNLLGIAFQPGEPSRGYAVGQQGVLLSYGKTWTQEPTCEPGAPTPARCIPPEVAGASFTSIAFAGSEAIVAYRLFHPGTENKASYYTGGLLVNSGSGWQVDQAAASALGEYIPWAVAGLEDGGAALSATLRGFGGGTGLILERNGPSEPWTPTTAPYPNDEAPGSLAIFREAGQVRVIGSAEIPNTVQLEEVTQPPAGFPPALIDPYPIDPGYVIRQTAIGWADEEHDRNSVTSPPANYSHYDMVYQGDPTSAVLVNSSGTQGWAVGGIVDPERGKGDTADISRYPAEASSPPGIAEVNVPVNSSDATFAIGGGAPCAAPCAARANARIGPDVWLSSALALAARTPGVRAFIDTGPRVSTGATNGAPFGSAALGIPYAHELSRYASILGSSGLPSYAALTKWELSKEGECTFEEAFSGFPAPFGTSAGNPVAPLPISRSAEPCAAGQAGYYAMESTGASGTVRVIVLDDSATEAGATEGNINSSQLSWLQAELANAAGAKHPAIVVGSSDLHTQIAQGDPQAALVARALIEGEASAYFFDAPGENVEEELQVPGIPAGRPQSVKAFGSGTLGYVAQVASEQPGFHGHSGFLLAQVDVAERGKSNPVAPNVAPVSAPLIPDVGELALEAKNGLLLRRSQAALFGGLARRPRAGGIAAGSSVLNESALYTPLPAECVPVGCPGGILPAYTFTSSNPKIGEFVERNPLAGEANAVLLGTNGKPIPDPQSGLFCAYNKGETEVKIEAGGLSAALKVVVQEGSVRRPCGTQPIESPVAESHPISAPTPLAPATAGPSASPTPLPLPLPPVPAPVPVPPPARVPPPPVLPVPLLAPASTPLAAIVPPPLAPPAEPTPPSGTSAVTSPANAPEREEEEEGATESVSNQAVAYRESEHQPAPEYLLGLILLAAFAGAGVRRRPRRGRREVRIAPATISSMHAQRRMARTRRRPW